MNKEYISLKRFPRGRIFLFGFKRGHSCPMSLTQAWEKRGNADLFKEYNYFEQVDNVDSFLDKIDHLEKRIFDCPYCNKAWCAVGDIDIISDDDCVSIVCPEQSCMGKKIKQEKKNCSCVDCIAKRVRKQGY